MNYTITVTDLERKGLEYAAADVGEWLTLRAKTRAEAAIQDIVALNTAHCNANNIAIALDYQTTGNVSYAGDNASDNTSQVAQNQQIAEPVARPMEDLTPQDAPF